MRKLTGLLCVVVLSLSQFWAVAAYAESITLAWTANTEPDLEGYRLYRSVTGCPAGNIPGPPIATIPAGTHTYTDQLVTDGTICYALTAFDQVVNSVPPSGNNESAQSAKISKTVVSTVPPSYTLRMFGLATSAFGVEAVTASPLPTGYKFDIYINGVFSHSEGGLPYCWPSQGGTPLACVGAVQPEGSYHVEFRLMRGTVEVSRQALTIVVSTAADITPPVPPGGFMIVVP
jgi:hypothetical protein